MTRIQRTDGPQPATRTAGSGIYDRRKHGVHNLQKPEVMADPHLYIQDIRELDPVFYDEVGRVWVCTGYTESVDVLTNHATFSSSRLNGRGDLRERGLTETANVLGMLDKQLLFNDAPAHTEMRSPIKEHFTVARVRSWDGVMSDIVGRSLARLPTNGIADLIGDFAVHLSSPLVSRLLAMEGREAEISRWAEAYETLLGSVSTLPDVRDTAVIPVLAEALATFRIEGRARIGGDGKDVLSTMVRSGHPQELEESDLNKLLYGIAANCIVLVGGGYQTLTHLVSTGLRLLDRNPEQQHLLRRNPELIDSAIDEFMRLDGSSQYLARQVNSAVILGGHEIPAGDSVLVHLGAANMDPRKFSNPIHLNIERREARHLGFGMGRHYCIGAPYAERIAGIAILKFLERYESYSVIEEYGSLEWGQHPNTRCLAKALVRLGEFNEDASGTHKSPSTSTDTCHDTKEPNTELAPTVMDWCGSVRERRTRITWHEQFALRARSTPDAVAVECDAGVITYWELEQRSNALAHELRGRGVEPETVVGVVMERGLDFVPAILAVAKAGGAFMLADVTCPSERLARMLEDSKALLVLTDAATGDHIRTLSVHTPVMIIGTREDEDSAPCTGVSIGNSAYVVFTSGSTGHPKAIKISHEGLVNLHEGMGEIFRLGAADRVLQFLSPNFDGSIADIVLALLSGAQLVLASRTRLQVGPPLARLLKEKRITTVILTPSVWAALPAVDLPNLRIAAAAGERLTASLVRKWLTQHRRFLNLYGPAETATLTTWHECGHGDSSPPIGQPAANKKVYVLDSELRPLPVEMEGELCIGGVGVGRYMNRPDLMEQRFAVDPFAGVPGQLLYRTGDRCRWLANGTLEYLGRADRQVKIRGQRIELNEIESVIGEYPGVAACMAQEIGGELVASIVGDGYEIDEGALRQFLSRRLHTGMVPKSFQIVTNDARNTNGKTDWRALHTKETTTDDPTVRTYTAIPDKPPPMRIQFAELNMTRLTWIVAGLFARCLLLPRHRIKHDSDFFSIGGDSLATAQLLTLVEEAFGVSFDFEVLIDQCTPESLSEAIHWQLPELSRVSR